MGLWLIQFPLSKLFVYLAFKKVETSSSFSMLSFMTTLISPVLHSLRAPRGIFAMCSVTMHRTLNRVLYASWWEDGEDNRAVRVCTAAVRIILAQAISVAKGFLLQVAHSSACFRIDLLRKL